MKSFVALALAAGALAQLPSGCTDTRAGSFQISVVNVTSSKRSLQSRQLSGITVATLQGGILKDQAGRTGNIVANHQFQFDNPLQNNALATSGFGICGNNSIVAPTTKSTIFYQCLSGDFFNLYDISLGGQCSPIYLVAVAQTSGAVSQATDGQPQATSQIKISQISDGQPQQPTGRPISQISDGQPQAPTRMLSQISDGQPQVRPTPPVISQISDGQPQLRTTTAPVLSQISDGQPQLRTSTAPVLSQISDGQPQLRTSSGVKLSQISDGQPQVRTSSGALLSQITDGQPQIRTSATGPVLSQITDGQPQITLSTARAVVSTASTPAQFTGAAVTPQAGAGAFAAGVFGLMALL